MGKTSSIKALIKAIDPITFGKRTEITKQLEDIRKKAAKVVEHHGSINVLYDDENSYSHSPLEAAVNTGSIEIFKLLIKLGADPFFKPRSDLPSVAEILGINYITAFGSADKCEDFEWLMLSANSPLLTWNKLKANAHLFNKFSEANLIPKQEFVNELPLHVVVDAGRLDLLDDLVNAAGNIQRAGDIHGVSILHSATMAVLQGKKNSLEVLEYLLKAGASYQAADFQKLPAIMQVIYAKTFYLPGWNVKQKTVIDIIKLMLENGASLDVVNPNNGYNPLMAALSAGYTDLFTYLLANADTNTVNYQAKSIPGTMAFQLFDRGECKIPQGEILKLLPELKNKGLMFDQTKGKSYCASPFKKEADSSRTSAANMSVLHYYVDGLANGRENLFDAMDRHIETIQTLIAYGANPALKATFTQTNEQRDSYSRDNKKVHTNLELTAAEYVRKIAINGTDPFGYRNTFFFLRMDSKDESTFLNHISHLDKSEQVESHKKFHQFRNLELVLSGQKPVPYAGMPDADKLARVASKKQLPVVTSQPEVAADKTKQDQVVVPKETFKPEQIEANLFKARGQQNQSEWQAIKKPLVEYVKQADSMQEFLTRIKQFEKPLQLHYNITTNAEGKVTSQGSFLYRFFHMFDSHKFPQSWETLRQFGRDTYGVDINMEYDERKTNTI